MLRSTLKGYRRHESVFCEVFPSKAFTKLQLYFIWTSFNVLIYYAYLIFSMKTTALA